MLLSGINSSQLLFVRYPCLHLKNYTKDENIEQVDVRKVYGGKVKTDKHVNKNAVKERQPARRVDFAYLPHRSNKKKLCQNIENKADDAFFRKHCHERIVRKKASSAWFSMFWHSFFLFERC